MTDYTKPNAAMETSGPIFTDEGSSVKGIANPKVLVIKYNNGKLEWETQGDWTPVEIVGATSIVRESIADPFVSKKDSFGELMTRAGYKQ